MPDGPVTAEALARVEHKLDLLLWFLLKKEDPMLLAALRGGAFPQMGDEGTPCPVCAQNPVYQIDFVNRVVARKCGCSTGLQPPMNPQAFAPPAPPAEGPRHGYAEHEDGSNPNPGPASRARRHGPSRL